jgi:hypothetical protein
MTQAGQPIEQTGHGFIPVEQPEVYSSPRPPQGPVSALKGEHMKGTTLALTLALCFAGTAFAQNANMGIWKLNEAKSKIPAGYMKNTTVTYEMDGGNVKVTTDGTDRDGKPMQTSWTGKFDGKDYPLTGDPTADTRTYTQVNDHTLRLSNKMGGKVVTSGTITVAADGKTRTLKVSGTDKDGKKVSSTAVYDKQ